MITIDHNLMKHNPNQRRNLLRSLINKYIKKNHIRMKNVLTYYRSLIDHNKSLKKKHFHQILPYLEREFTNTTYEIESYFQSLLDYKPEPPPPNTLIEWIR